MTSHPASLLGECRYGKAFFNGREIQQVWYCDTERGVIQTYDVFGDGKAHIARKEDGRFYSADDFPGREVDIPSDGNGILSETLRGQVELYGPAKVA